MKAVLIEKFGSAEQLKIGEWETPTPQSEQLLVRVEATALNRADIIQREGKYPPPAGASPILGLEIAGEIVAKGQDVNGWNIGDKICGLVPGGGYAEFAVIHQSMAMPIPKGLQISEAVAIPEVFLTAFQALNKLAHLQKDEIILIHAGASGVGTATIQIAKQIGAVVITTSSEKKLGICQSLGADYTLNYQQEDFVSETQKITHQKGVNVIIDFMGASYLQRNIEALSVDGRLVLLGLMGGSQVENLNLAKVLFKRVHLLASTLRARSLEYQIELNRAFVEMALPLFESGKWKPLIDTVYSWKDVIKAHQYMESNQNAGKIILTID